jgi:hypothetical protein
MGLRPPVGSPPDAVRSGRLSRREYPVIDYPWSSKKAIIA